METSFRDGSVRALVSKLPNPCPQRRATKRVEGQAEEEPDAGGELKLYVGKRPAPVLLITSNRRRIGEATMGGDWLPRPGGTGFSGRLIANGEDESVGDALGLANSIQLLLRRPLTR